MSKQHKYPNNSELCRFHQRHRGRMKVFRVSGCRACAGGFAWYKPLRYYLSAVDFCQKCGRYNEDCACSALAKEEK
jgi:hypothetical protein